MALLFNFLVGMELRVLPDVFSFADGKAPEDLIPQMQAFNLLENKKHLLDLIL